MKKLTDFLSPSQTASIQEMLDRFDFDGAKAETVKLAASMKFEPEEI